MKMHQIRRKRDTPLRRRPRRSLLLQTGTMMIGEVHVQVRPTLSQGGPSPTLSQSGQEKYLYSTQYGPGISLYQQRRNLDRRLPDSNHLRGMRGSNSEKITIPTHVTTVGEETRKGGVHKDGSTSRSSRRTDLGLQHLRKGSRTQRVNETEMGFSQTTAASGNRITRNTR